MQVVFLGLAAVALWPSREEYKGVEAEAAPHRHRQGESVPPGRPQRQPKTEQVDSRVDYRDVERSLPRAPAQGWHLASGPAFVCLCVLVVHLNENKTMRLKYMRS
jgi:hypothetical protein